MWSNSRISTSCVRFQVTIFHAEQHTLLIQSLQQGNSLCIHLPYTSSWFPPFQSSLPLWFLHWLQPWEMMTVTNIQQTVGQRSLSFTTKYLYNKILSHVWNSQFEYVNKLCVQGINFHGWSKICQNSDINFIILEKFLLYGIMLYV